MKARCIMIQSSKCVYVRTPFLRNVVGEIEHSTNCFYIIKAKCNMAYYTPGPVYNST